MKKFLITPFQVRQSINTILLDLDIIISYLLILLSLPPRPPTHSLDTESSFEIGYPPPFLPSNLIHQ
jgi:hypothetical protein